MKRWYSSKLILLEKIIISLQFLFFSTMVFPAIINIEPQQDRYFFMPLQEIKKTTFLLVDGYQTYFSLGGSKYFNHKVNISSSYDLFLPLLQQQSNYLLFADLRIFDCHNYSFEGNFHLGYRRLNLEARELWGVYVAIDHKVSAAGNNFYQATFGVESWLQSWFMGWNIYWPLRETKRPTGEYMITASRSITAEAITETTIVNSAQEKNLAGFDAEIGYAVTNNFTTYLAGYYFGAKDVSAIAGSRICFVYDYQNIARRILGILDGVSVEVGMQYDQPRGKVMYFGVKLKAGFIGSDEKRNLVDFERHMVALIRRDPDIVVVATNSKTEAIVSKKILIADIGGVATKKCVAETGWAQAECELLFAATDSSLNFREAAEASLLVYPAYAKELYLLSTTSDQETLKVDSNIFKSLRGYKIFDIFDHASGFYAVALQKIVNDDERRKEYLVAIRGTEFTKRKDLLNDLQLFFGRIPDQYKSATIFINKILADVGEQAKVAVTGHSLGGVLAEMIAAKFGISAVAFESVGAKKVVEKISSDKFNLKKITIINAYPNIINTYGEQAAIPIEIHNGGKPCSWSGCSLVGVFSSGYLNSHDMRSMLGGINDDGGLVYALREKQGGFSISQRMYNAAPEVYDQQIYQLWQTKSANNFWYNFPGVPQLFLQSIYFRMQHPVFASYKRYVVSKLLNDDME